MMPAGRYYVGDLCYVMHEHWDEVCKLLFAGRTDHGCNQGEFNLSNGMRFAIYNTAYGDGTYFDQERHSYGVDAGSIGCILLDNINLENEENFLHGGQVFVFDNDFTTSNDNGVIKIGTVEIDTVGDDYDEDEFFDDGEE